MIVPTQKASVIAFVNNDITGGKNNRISVEMKKSITRITALLLSLIILTGGLPISVSATSAANVAELWIDGELESASADSFEDLWVKAVKLAPLKTDKNKKDQEANNGSH